MNSDDIGLLGDNESAWSRTLTSEQIKQWLLLQLEVRLLSLCAPHLAARPG
jgi:hypothetical protein